MLTIQETFTLAITSGSYGGHYMCNELKTMVRKGLITSEERVKATRAISAYLNQLNKVAIAHWKKVGTDQDREIIERDYGHLAGLDNADRVKNIDNICTLHSCVMELVSAQLEDWDEEHYNYGVHIYGDWDNRPKTVEAVRELYKKTADKAA